MLNMTSMSMKYPLCKDVFKLQHVYSCFITEVWPFAKVSVLGPSWPSCLIFT